jgi:hypothetical protein
LASASGGRDHTTSPSAPVSLVARHRYVHRIPRSTFVTTRPPLFIEHGTEGDNHLFLKNASRIICAEGWTAESALHHVANVGFFAYGILPRLIAETSVAPSKINQLKVCRPNHDVRKRHAAATRAVRAPLTLRQKATLGRKSVTYSMYLPHVRNLRLKI